MMIRADGCCKFLMTQQPKSMNPNKSRFSQTHCPLEGYEARTGPGSGMAGPSTLVCFSPTLP